MDAFSRELNDLLVTTFWSVLKVEEQMLKADHSLNLSINELHLIESVGKENERGKPSVTLRWIWALPGLQLPFPSTSLLKKDM